MESWISDLGLQKSIANTRIAVQPQYSLSEALKGNKPYFGRRLSAFQSPPVRYALLAAVVKYALRGKENVRLLEIGSWAGASAITLGASIRQLGIPDSAIICIDPWEQYFVQEDRGLHYKIMNLGVATGATQTLFHHNIRTCELQGMIEVVKAASREALPKFDDRSFNLIYVDGSHKKEDVLYDVEQAKRLVSEGGVICGDDLELVKSQIDPSGHIDALGRDVDFVLDQRSGVSYHPGVTEALAVAFGDVWHEKGLWCVERSEQGWSAPVLQVDDLDIPVHLQHAVEVPYGLFKGYELFQLGEEFVAYPVGRPFWFQNRLVQGSLEELVLLVDSIDAIDRSIFLREAAGTELVVEGYCGFNIVRHNGGWYGFNQALGATDIGGLGESALEDMKRNGSCVTGESAADVKAEILRLVMRQTKLGLPVGRLFSRNS
jgi:predicted O-methyltransferase YrrM